MHLQDCPGSQQQNVMSNWNNLNATSVILLADGDNAPVSCHSPPHLQCKACQLLHICNQEKVVQRRETKLGPQRCPIWKATLLACCNIASAEEGMFSRVLPFCEKSTSLASLTLWHWLVRSYITTKTLSSTGIASRKSRIVGL